VKNKDQACHLDLLNPAKSKNIFERMKTKTAMELVAGNCYAENVLFRK